ncbi:MAG TPA: cation-transporting P-type ATPase, partial [Firmicutes bacterium]|nr:cation-transporting P-type ATPase [Bacillota bacterium]
MQRFILSKKNLITLLGGILITAAFISKLGFDNTDLFHWTLVVASVLGVIPIAIQAYQALKVKVVSIDVLVTIAVAGAFFI